VSRYVGGSSDGGFGNAAQKHVSAGYENVGREPARCRGVAHRDTHPGVAPQGFKYGGRYDGGEDDARVGRQVGADADEGDSRRYKPPRRAQNGLAHQGGDHSGLLDNPDAEHHGKDQA
jgi:hypothetical protein